MAATDKNYRSLSSLHVVFGASCLLMLVSVVWMFAQDYFLEWKDDQRLMRDVAVAVAQRQALERLPDAEKIQQIQQKVTEAQDGLDKTKIAEIQKRIDKGLPEKIKTETDFQTVKADYDSIVSIYNIEVEERNGEKESGRRSVLDKRVEETKRKIDDLEKKMAVAQGKYEEAKGALDQAQRDLAEVKKPVTDALAELKKFTDEFDRFRKSAELNQWGFGDWFRALPVLDAFASPTRIQQFTLEDLPIEYGSFKRVTRYDRCMTCHQGIDRTGYDKNVLAALNETTPDQQEKVKAAQKLLEERRKVLQKAGAEGTSSGDLRLATLKLSESNVNEFCIHPRLDLFVDSNSPHPTQKFGCTICHEGQGSATEFSLASHSPNDFATRERWQKQHRWEYIHFWDYPMLPKRFVESSCLKCHHQVTDLIREGVKNEAPKLLRGFNLVRENGCFGCHEIAGLKGGRPIGPDMRLEPYPALDELSPGEKVKALSDPQNPPGTMRKVGPSLRRITEKTNTEWTRKWIANPRGFRPDTKMPHFYGLSTNAADVLPEDQKAFPDAEIHGIAAYIFHRSNEYLNEVDKLNREPEQAVQAVQADFERLSNQPSLSDADKVKLEEASRWLRLRATPPRIKDLAPAGYAGDAANGARLFRERGCLACHIHESTEKAAAGLPALHGEAQFGPNLSRVALKLGATANDRVSARRWLIQWVKNPNVHNPRTFMPITHLEDKEAADIAAWLLDQKEAWEAADLPEPSIDTLKSLARVYLERIGTRQDVESLLNPKDETAKSRGQDWVKGLRPDADEGELLVGDLNADKLKLYVGKKAMNRLGCYGCHDIPGFESSKPIGTPLNDWGKKDPERLAFEDVAAFVKKTYDIVEKTADGDGKPVAIKDGKKPYEKFFFESLDHHHRDGFLYQKLREPRSYDYDRLRPWDDRLRMPQFKFARSEPRAEESKEDFEARSEKEEAEAREAVMTFVLGLLAEPIPFKFLNQPKAERGAEVRGRQVLEKFNCGGCHLLRPGIYDFKKSRELTDDLEEFYNTAQRAASTDYGQDPQFIHHNAWAGTLSTQPDRVSVHGIALPGGDGKLNLRLVEALRFVNNEQKVRDIPAASTLQLSADAATSQAPAYGGAFANLLVPYVTDRSPGFNESQKKSPQAALPPALTHEGEKVQPSWLFQFLKNPQPIRPLTILRMPKFNMSDDEAMALVTYFAAVDKESNPGVTVNYPYMAVPQRDEGFWQTHAAGYTARLKDLKLDDKRIDELKPIWERLLNEQILNRKAEVEKAEQTLKTGKDEATKKAAQTALDASKESLAKLDADAKSKDGKGGFFQEQMQSWESLESYAGDAYRLVANNSICLTCHSVGRLKIQDAKGPPLELSAERLRPDWTLRWVANPQRFLTYPSVMPQNFPNDKTKPPFPEFAGTWLEQATAARDVLMNILRVADMPVNRFYQPPPGGEEKK